MHPLAASILFHAIGAAAAACCYVPQKRVRGWSWQSYWLTQASFCWLLLPVIGAFLTVPDFWQVVREAPRDAMLRTFLLGAAYGIGGTAFGVAIRYVGFSVTYATAIGISTVVGTAFNCDGNTIRNKRVAFSSSNSAVATVTPEGNVIAVAVGQQDQINLVEFVEVVLAAPVGRVGNPGVNQNHFAVWSREFVRRVTVPGQFGLAGGQHAGSKQCDEDNADPPQHIYHE